MKRTWTVGIVAVELSYESPNHGEFYEEDDGMYEWLLRGMYQQICLCGESLPKSHETQNKLELELLKIKPLTTLP